jgi:hypothetical protein
MMKKLMAMLFAGLLTGAITMPGLAAGHPWKGSSAAQAQTQPKKKKKAPTPPAALDR